MTNELNIDRNTNTIVRLQNEYDKYDETYTGLRAKVLRPNYGKYILCGEKRQIGRLTKKKKTINFIDEIILRLLIKAV